MKNFVCLVLLFSLVAFVGCGANQSGGPDIPAGASEALADTHSLILEASYGGSPIKTAKDLDQYNDRFPKAVAALKSGDVKMVWGKSIQDNVKNAEVIAYEAKAESGEGFAVKNDGKIHKVTSSDLPKSK